MPRLSERGEAVLMCLLAGSYFGYVSGIIGGLGSSIVKCRFFNESVSGEGANESSGVGLLSDPNAGDETSAFDAECIMARLFVE